MQWSVGLLIGFIVLVVFGATCLIVWLGIQNEQRKREKELIVEQQQHEERMAMVERGMMPPSTETPQQKMSNADKAYSALGGIAVGTAVFAFLSGGSAMAWAAEGFIGVAAAVGVLVVYLRSSGSPNEI